MKASLYRFAPLAVVALALASAFGKTLGLHW